MPAFVTVALAGTPEALTADYVCDGFDDQVEINAAIVHASTLGGGVVSIATGNYSTSLPISFSKIYFESAAVRATTQSSGQQMIGLHLRRLQRGSLMVPG